MCPSNASASQNSLWALQLCPNPSPGPGQGTPCSPEAAPCSISCRQHCKIQHLVWVFPKSEPQPGFFVFWKKAAHHCLSQFCSVFAEPHHGLTQQPSSPQHQTPWHFTVLEQTGSFECVTMIILQLPVVCAHTPGSLTPKALQFLTNRKQQRPLPLTFRGVQLPVIASIAQSLTEAVSLIQISAHLWRGEFHMHVERAVKLLLLQTELIPLGRELWCGTKPAWTGLVKHRMQQGANSF